MQFKDENPTPESLVRGNTQRTTGSQMGRGEEEVMPLDPNFVNIDICSAASQNGSEIAPPPMCT